ncbi:MAG: hypothetical protein ACR2H3_11280 [Acidimicrobiales bacterium]
MGTHTASSETATRVRTPEERGSRAVAIFGSWMIFGLFLDGWAHQAEKPETFFSPWHGVLYSGFVAAVVWFGWDSRRHRDGGAEVDRLATAGLVAFIVGAVGDGIWHELLGIEVDIEALLSPTHLALMIGGALMVSAPIRASRGTIPDRPTLRQFVPTLASVTLVTSLVLFFLMYLSAAYPVALHRWADEGAQIIGIAAILVRTAVMLGASFVVLRRWHPPFGTFTVLWAVPAVALSGLEGFRGIALAIPFVLAGLAADVIVDRSIGGSRTELTLAMVTPFLAWSSYFAIHAVVWGVHWPAEIWTGAIVFAVLLGVGITLISPPDPRERASVSTDAPAGKASASH